MKDSNAKKEINLKISPTEQGYKDRKMAKWQGFILSDHADLLKQKKNELVEYAAKEKQPLSVISESLHHSFTYKQGVAIQLDFIVDGSYEPDIIGIVTGFESEKIFVQTDAELIIIDLTLVRQVEVLSATKWFRSGPT